MRTPTSHRPTNGILFTSDAGVMNICSQTKPTRQPHFLRLCHASLRVVVVVPFDDWYMSCINMYRRCIVERHEDPRMRKRLDIQTSHSSWCSYTSPRSSGGADLPPAVPKFKGGPHSLRANVGLTRPAPPPPPPLTPSPPSPRRLDESSVLGKKHSLRTSEYRGTPAD